MCKINVPIPAPTTTTMTAFCGLGHTGPLSIPILQAPRGAAAASTVAECGSTAAATHLDYMWGPPETVGLPRGN